MQIERALSQVNLIRVIASTFALRQAASVKMRLLVMLSAGLWLLLGLATGLTRLGWGLAPAHLAAHHGPLLAAGFLGTLIALERAVALGQGWAYLAPALMTSGAATLVSGHPGSWLILAGSLVLLAVNLALHRRQPSTSSHTMVLGTLALGVGNLLWVSGRQPGQVVLWWASFLVLTIAAERLELSRLRQPPAWSQAAFLSCVLLLVLGLWLDPTLVGVAFLGLTAWLGRFDLAWRTVRARGLTRYIAVCLLTGYFWLGLGGLLLVTGGLPAAGPWRDAALHAIFLGFVMAMIFGHGPLIFPALTGLRIPFRKVFYAPLLLLHLSLAVRVWADLAGPLELRPLAALGNAAAILAFQACMVLSASRAATGRPEGRAPLPPAPPVAQKAFARPGRLERPAP